MRDTLLGLAPKDFDYATPLIPDEIESKIRESGKRAFVTGKRFGTLAFMWEGNLVEITTFRAEKYEPGSRKPSVEFTKSIEQDLGRRDFTINAIAIRDERIIDPFGGKDDLEAKILRSVGNAAERFNDDPLRLLRLARFTAQLGFTIEDRTLKAAQKKAHTILDVSRERWVQELDKLLLTDIPSIGLEALHEIGILAFMLPELQIQVGYDQHSPYHAHTLWEHTKRVVDGVAENIDLRWAALLHDIGKPSTQVFKDSGQANYIFHEQVSAELTYGIAKRLKWSEERRKAVTDLIENHAEEGSPLRQADNNAH